MEDVRTELTKVLRKWVDLSDAEAEAVMGFVTEQPKGWALAITGPIGSGKTWLANVIRALAPELTVIDSLDTPLSQWALDALADDRALVVVSRGIYSMQSVAAKRRLVVIIRNYVGPSSRAMDIEEVQEDVEHAMGRRTTSDKLTEGLRNWAERKEITPAAFSKITGFSYQHAHNLLRGNSRVTEETLGRVVLSYGLEAIEDILGLVRKGE